jgi:prevent-host-death family protein
MESRDKNAVTAATARDNLSELINRAAYGKERVLLTRRGKALAALVPMEDMKRLEALEDQEDAAEAARRLKAWRKGGRKGIPLETVAKEYDIKLPKRRGLAR